MFDNIKYKNKIYYCEMTGQTEMYIELKDLIHVSINIKEKVKELYDIFLNNEVDVFLQEYEQYKTNRIISEKLYQISVSKENINLIKCLINNDLEIKIHMVYLALCNLEILKLVFEHFTGDIKPLDNNEPALLSTVMYGEIEIIKYLVEHCKIKIDKVIGNLLWHSADKGNYPIFHYLIELGANVDQDDGFLLYHAAKEDNYELLVECVKAGADIHKRNSRALKIFAKNNNRKAVIFLLENGANVKVLSRSRRHILYI